MDNKLDNFQAPVIIPANNQSKLVALKKSRNRLAVMDEYSNQLEELFAIRYPKSEGNLKKLEKFVSKLFGNKQIEKTGNWVYFPWNNNLVHVLDDLLFQELRMSRNFPLIKKTEQRKFYDLNVGVVGLSVGSSIVKSLIYSGGAKSLKLADPDRLSLSNLNRIQAGIADVGLNKCVLTARQVYEVNPYAQLKLFSDGINANNINDFFVGNPRLDLVIDAADDLIVKFNLRLMARAYRIPLLMTTDNGLESNTQVIRFDKDVNAGGMKDVPILNTEDIVAAYKNHEPLDMSEKQKLKVITDLVGIKNVSSEMQVGSMMRAERKIAGWPQVAMTVFLGGALAAYAAKLVAIGAKTYKKQTSFSLGEHLKPSYKTSRNKSVELKKTNKFIKFLKTLK